MTRTKAERARLFQAIFDMAAAAIQSMKRRWEGKT